jgi:hypothetical protein
MPNTFSQFCGRDAPRTRVDIALFLPIMPALDDLSKVVCSEQRLNARGDSQCRQRSMSQASLSLTIKRDTLCTFLTRSQLLH